MVILQDPATKYRVVVTVETEKYNLLALGYTDVSAEVMAEVAESFKAVEKEGTRGAQALGHLKKAAAGAKQGNTDLTEVVDAVTTEVVEDKSK